MTLPFQNDSLPIEDRVDDLLGRLSFEEKIGQLTQYFYFPVDTNIPADENPMVAQTQMVEEAIAASAVGSVLFVKDPETTNRLQRRAIEHHRLGVPLLFGYDVTHGMRTIFPVPIALAATWDVDAVESAQEVAARETRALGVHWTFAPMIDIARDPRWGRIVEGAGEDPLLTGAIAAAQVRGFQGELGGDRILAGPKHLVGYGAGRGGRDYEDAEISESELWNVYLPPFRAAVEAGAATVMSAYMDLNGVPASANRWLLTDVLRDSLGFEGFTVSDANAVRNLKVQHLAKDFADAAGRALTAGLDMEMTMFDPAYAHLPEAMRRGEVSIADIDAAVRRVLTAKFALGLFEDPYVDEARSQAVLAAEEHRDRARTVAEKSLVLLKNANAALPLAADSGLSIAVIGQLADSKRDTLGPWVFDHDTEETTTILEAVRERVGSGGTVSYAPGVAVPERFIPCPFDMMDPSIVPTPADYPYDDEIDRAVRLAAESDVAVVVVGQRQNQSGEKASVSTLDLPERQLEQLQRIVATGTPVVVVVMGGRPLDLTWAQEHVGAILLAWHPGTRGGQAVAATLFGDVSPAGRLPFTWPRHVGQVPMIYAHYETFHPEEEHERYFNEPSTPLYPFGHGLSYAEFEYGPLELEKPILAIGESITVSAQVANVSDIDSDEVVQLYIHQRHGTSSRPSRELKAFRRVHVPARSAVSVEFELGPADLRYWSAVTKDFVQDATELDLWVGGDALAASHATLRVTAVDGD